MEAAVVLVAIVLAVAEVIFILVTIRRAFAKNQKT